ncbi:MAG: DUF4097 family beta strand repeat protein [Firmicutes bacterium]|nr:DUF4097 family beta strand repeat protein [Bacillota bacterium]
MVLALAALSLAGCSTLDYSYENADKYTAGDKVIADKIDKIDLDYVAGNVDITAAVGNAISVKETANRELEEKEMVHTWVDGTTLRIKYCASDCGMSVEDLEKNLTLAVPKNIGLDEMKLDLAAGDLKADLGKIGKFKLDAAAGDLDVTAAGVKVFDVDAAAGNCTFDFAKAPGKTSIDAAAGDIKIKLPKDCDLTLKIDMAAGDLNFDLPFKKKDKAYVCGNGSSVMSIDCAAGDINITGR